MFIKSLLLKNFRNYTNLNIEFSPGINFIVGQNGAGKTNILEGISILSGIRSFRNVSDHEIIQWGQESYYCHAAVMDSPEKEFEVGCALIADRLKKRAKIDSAEMHRISEYFGRLLTVVFSPSDIQIINGNPELRRKFFDRIISQVDLNYLNSLTELKKILISRNRLLKQLQSRRTERTGELDIWDRMLAERSSVIINKRAEFVEKFSASFGRSYSSIASEDDPPRLTYESNITARDPEAIYSVFYSSRMRDFAIGSTSAGPHRDDYGFISGNGRTFKNIASQGQRRTAAIALKSAECNFLEQSTGKKVVLMVDDIFSELDETRRENMVHILKRDNQVLFTMVDQRFADLKKFGSFKKLIVKGNGLIREE